MGSFSLNPIPVTPEAIERMGDSKLKKQNGKYTSVGTPNVAAMKTPLTPHGINVLKTVPESSKARDKAVGSREDLSKEGFIALPGKIIDRYCSPIKTLAKIPPMTVAEIKLVGDVNLSAKGAH